MDSDALINIAKKIRKDVLKLALDAGKQGAHIGGGLSLPEILTALYFEILNIDPRYPFDENRDRFILSKGHGAIALYAILRQKGFLTDAELLTFKTAGSQFCTHPAKHVESGIEFSSGSLGQGLSLGAGTALALKKKKNFARVVVLLGDGECNEGSVWEAAAFTSHHMLNNLTVIIDSNRLQVDGRTSEILSMDNMSERWRSFGFDAFDVDGHCIPDLLDVLSRRTEKPIAIIANTVKGKGVSFIENNPAWHACVLNEDQYHQAMFEQESK